jgi:hypothetical protein
MPYFQANLSGDVSAEGRQISRDGWGDFAFRFTKNLIGSPALTPAEFAQRTPTTTLGVSVAVVAPTGDYNSQYLINISSHRWAFRPEIGASQPIGNWFVEAISLVPVLGGQRQLIEFRTSLSPCWIVLRQKENIALAVGRLDQMEHFVNKRRTQEGPSAFSPVQCSTEYCRRGVCRLPTWSGDTRESLRTTDLVDEFAHGVRRTVPFDLLTGLLSEILLPTSTTRLSAIAGPSRSMTWP